MDALLQRVEVEAGRAGDHELGVDHAPLGQGGAERVDQLGEVARQRALVAAAQLHLVAVAEHDAAEAVPLRLVEPAVAFGEGVGGLGEHRGEQGA